MRYRGREQIIWIFFGAFLSCFAADKVLLAEFQEPIPTEREAFLDEIQKRALRYFIEQVNPANGLVRDWGYHKSNPFKPENEIGRSHAPATIAGTGFALSAYAVGVERGWLHRADAIRLVRTALLFLRDSAPHQRGFFYHFLNFDDGKRAGRSELSSVDTALAVAGILFAAEYLKDPEITGLAQEIYERIDWVWMLNGGSTFALGWSPEKGFFPNRWSHYDESALTYLLALGSSTHPIPAESWRKLVRRVGSYKSYRLIQSPPLFTHQYPQIWFDFRNKNDGFADYFENSKNAALAHRQFAIDQSAGEKFADPQAWGFTASESASGYAVYGAPPGMTHYDGTVAPTGCGASIVFTPEESLACLEHFRDTYGHELWGRYGFSDAFNPQLFWYSEKVYAINQGPIMLMVENYRSELIWNVMNRIPSVERAFERAGFRSGTMELPWPPPHEAEAKFLQTPIQIDGRPDDWPSASEKIVINSSALEHGDISGEQDLHGEVRFAWDKGFFYFFAEVEDDFIFLRNLRNQIYRDDLVELYIDPEGDGLFWGEPEDFQIGFRVNAGGDVETWAWFQGGGNPSKKGEVNAKGLVTDKGYQIEGAIRWSYLGFNPEPPKELKLSVGIHDIDQDRGEVKYNWFFRSEGELNRFELGKINLNGK